MGQNSDLFKLNITSFGFAHRQPSDANLVYDVRSFPNPFYVPELKDKTGNDYDVQEFVMGYDVSNEFIDLMKKTAELLIPMQKDKGLNSLNIAIGCTGGHHRSVVFVNMLAEALEAEDCQITIRHMDINS